MEDNLSKYLRLFGTIFFSFLGVIVALVLLFLGVRLFFGLLNYIPWFSYVYTIFILLVPACLFMCVFVFYFYRTRTHRSKAVRVVSYTIFTLFLLAWIICLSFDVATFFRQHQDPRI